MKSNHRKPLIGVVPDYREGSQKCYSVRPHYVLRRNYVDMLNRDGAMVILLPYDYEAIENYLELIDGLMIVGGFFDINPKKYGATETHPAVTLNETRENFEFSIVEKALKTDMPILGICNGMQLLNIMHGGDIIQHIPDDPQFINHEQSKVEGMEDSAKAYHDVEIKDGTLLHKIVGAKKIPTNSSHHQGVKKAGKGLVVSAFATDGMIEAIEDPAHPFCIGVQWHPEFDVSQADQKIFASFVNAAQNYKIKHNL
jgi:putative glutamine amidotransferase